MYTGYQEQFNRIDALIGNTPLLKLTLKYKGILRNIYAKAEWFNLSGSIKDRVAYHILKEAYETGQIKKGDWIVEATSGNTGIAFAAMGAYLGNPVRIFMPDWMSQERIKLTASFGATVDLVSKEEGGFIASIHMAEEMGKEEGIFLPRQFSNEENTKAHYLTTGKEIVRQLAKHGLVADGVVAGVGTGGTIMGIGQRLREENPKCKVYPLEPINSPTLSTGYKVGKHRIQGISDEFIPDLLNLKELDEIIQVDDGDAIIMAQMLSRKLGLGVGISSGANLLGALLVQEELGPQSTIVTTFADDHKKYLSTDYSSEIPYDKEYLSNDVELISVEALA